MAPTPGQGAGCSIFTRLFFSARERRLRAMWRLLVQSFLLLLFIGLVAVPLALFLPVAADPNSSGFLLFNAVGLAIPITLSVYIARRWIDRRSFSSLGLKGGRRAWIDLLAGFLIAGVMMGFIFMTLWAFGWLQLGQGVEGRAGEIVGNLALALFTFILVGWGEELLLRGYWLRNLQDGLGLIWAGLLSSLVFAIGHSLNPNVSPVAIAGLVISGLFFVYATQASGALWLPIGLHIGWNFFEGTVFGFPVSGTQSFRLLHPEVNGPELIAGGAFGPEAGLVLLPALALGSLLIYLSYRRLHLRQSEPAARHP